MVQILKYTLISAIIIISSITFAINEEFTVPIYLTVPEYLKITELSKTRLDLNATNQYEDTLDFKVEANVEYYLDVKFTLCDAPTGNAHEKQIIESSHLSISDYPADSAKIDDDTIGILGIPGTPGSLTYSLTFWLEGGGWIYNASGRKIGDIQITVSSN
ncbi:hypothetical protein X925_07815 [Petrotoga sp. 9T1HF07.CasAA.8.2]|uniref:hypothetical protein n=1 Tax=Petrotoga sp. 9T1HF07.CasAA.8.2 TaxID=1434329 RepID=UPI000CCAFA03|nr:hypothetical protein [Petrotoga sp. 9T1HF07.CasAA.8.2]PNR87871.1 hypothetical protein X925_07815 [Petrotoga sp. 9T1HF07.CasAA.8.2]